MTVRVPRIGEANTVDARDGKVLVGRRSAGDGPVLGWWDRDAAGWQDAFCNLDHSIRRARIGPEGTFAWVDGKDDRVYVGVNEEPCAYEFPGVWVTATAKHLGICGPEPKVWDWKAGHEVWVHEGDDDTEEWGVVVCPHPDGEVVAVAGERCDAICLRRISDGQLLSSLQHEPTAFTGDLSFSPDGKYLAAIRHGEDIAARELLVFDTTTGDRLPMLNDRGAWTVRFTPDGRSIAFGTENGMKMRALADGSRTRLDLDETVRDLVFTSDRAVLVAREAGVTAHELW